MYGNVVTRSKPLGACRGQREVPGALWAESHIVIKLSYRGISNWPLNAAFRADEVNQESSVREVASYES